MRAKEPTQPAASFSRNAIALASMDDNLPNNEALTAAWPAHRAEPAKDHSSQANELALLFDMLTDRVERTVAFNGATEVILKVLKTRNG